MKETTKEWWKYQWKALRIWLACIAAAGAVIGVGMLIF